MSFNGLLIISAIAVAAPILARRDGPGHPGPRRYAHTRRSLVGGTEQGPTNQHQPAATTALHPRLQRP